MLPAVTWRHSPRSFANSHSSFLQSSKMCSQKLLSDGSAKKLGCAFHGHESESFAASGKQLHCIGAPASQALTVTVHFGKVVLTSISFWCMGADQTFWRKNGFQKQPGNSRKPPLPKTTRQLSETTKEIQLYRPCIQVILNHRTGVLKNAECILLSLFLSSVEGVPACCRCVPAKTAKCSVRRRPQTDAQTQHFSYVRFSSSVFSFLLCANLNAFFSRPLF